tara:strand:+ start:261 stop:512 length:252 start_codon:yes stop_codon:yes gene_type:complete
VKSSDDLQKLTNHLKQQEPLRVLNELLNHDLVIDITLMGSDNDYTVQLFLADKDSLFGRGSTLPEAAKDACAKFALKTNKHRN